MQSCPKNAHTGTGPTNKAKGPVSANNAIAIAENIPKTSSTSNISRKIENMVSSSVVIKPENNEKIDSFDLYSSSHKMLETPELTMSPARGSTGLQIPPTVQHEAVQPSEHNSSDNVNLSQRKQPRVGKSMERERQQQQHITMSSCGYQTSLETGNHSDDIKQEFTLKREGDVKKEKDCEEIDLSYRINPVETVKLERPEAPKEVVKAAPKQHDDVTLINESGDECIDYSTKRKLNDSCSEDVIELSDNSTVDPPAAHLKRRKLLEKPVSTPKKSPPNSYKSLIKQSNAANYPTSTSKAKLISSSINRLGNKTCIKRRSILKSKVSLKKMRLAVKAKKRAQKKQVLEDQSEKSESTSGEADGVPDTTKAIVEVSLKAADKSDDNHEGTSTETEQNEDKSMDGSSEYSGKSNIDLTIDRVAKGYFSESDIFSCLSKHRKMKSQKKFKSKVLKVDAKDKKKGKKTGKASVPVPEKKKVSKANKEADNKQSNCETPKTTKLKKTKACEEPKKKAKKQLETIEKDPLALDDVPSSQSTPKRKPKTPKIADKKAKKPKVSEVIEKVIESLAVDSEEDDKTVGTLEMRDDETSTTVLSSTQTVNTSKSLLDETDVANNNNECFEDNNRHKLQQESLTLYKTPGYGWTTFNKTKRGKKKFGYRKKHKLVLNDIVIPKSTSIPRWSNGWVWEGEPYQALVFLNVSLQCRVILKTITNYCVIYRAMIRQFQEHAMTRCVMRSAATSSDRMIVCF